jgi:hypothetical protein
MRKTDESKVVCGMGTKHTVVIYLGCVGKEGVLTCVLLDGGQVQPSGG